MTAMTRDCGARILTTCRLWRSAAMSIVALTIGVTRVSPKDTLGIGFRRVVFELGVLAQEGELHIAGRTIALLGDDDIGDALARGVLLVHFFAVNKKNQVAVLFQTARIVTYDAVRQPTRRARHGQVEHFFGAF